MYDRKDDRSLLWDYIQDNLAERGLLPAHLAKALGVHRSRLTDWKRGKSMSVATARAMAEFLDKPILDILVVSGQLTPEEANPVGTPRSLFDYSDTALVFELNRRLRAQKQAGADASPPDGEPVLTQ